MDALSRFDLVKKKKSSKLQTLMQDPNCYSWLTFEKRFTLIYCQNVVLQYLTENLSYISYDHMRHGQGETVQQEPDLLDFLQRIPQENLGNSRLVQARQTGQRVSDPFTDFTENLYPNCTN